LARTRPHTRARTRNAIDDERMSIDPNRRDHNLIIRANDDDPASIFTALYFVVIIKLVMKK